MQPLSPAERTDQPHRQTPTSIAPYLLLAAVLLLMVACLLHFDTAFVHATHAIRDTAVVITLAQVATKLGGDGAPVLALLLIIAARRWWRRIAMTVVGAFVIQQGLTELIKFLAGRMRPHQADGLTVFMGPASGYHSFPSGHTSYAFMLATIAAAYFPRGTWWFYAIALLVGIGRVMKDVHFLSDIIAGALIGYLAGWVLLRFLPPRSRAAGPRIPDAE